MLKSFSVKNYRNLNLENLCFKKINIIIGPNNSGKSNLIDSISFFSNMILRERNESAFLEELDKRGWDDLLNKKVPKPGKIDLKWEISTSKEHLDISYGLQFQVASADSIPKGFYITEEYLKYSKPTNGQTNPFEFINCHGKHPGKGKFSVRENNLKRKLNNVTLDVDSKDTVFRQVSSLLDSEEFRLKFYPNFKQTVQDVQEFFQRFHNHSGSGFDLDLIKDASKVELNSQYLKKDGSNFGNVLRYLDDKYNFLDTYLELLQELIFGLERIKFVNVSESKQQVRLILRGKEYKLSEMSDGTLKAMLLALLLWSPEQSSILAIDEPEMNLHPAWIKVIANWVQRTQTIDQIFISTHSADLLDSFTEKFMSGDIGLFVCNLTDEPNIVPLLPEKIQHVFHEGWELGDLYRVGDPLLGGWPW